MRGAIVAIVSRLAHAMNFAEFEVAGFAMRHLRRRRERIIAKRNVPPLAADYLAERGAAPAGDSDRAR